MDFIENISVRQLRMYYILSESVLTHGKIYKSCLRSKTNFIKGCAVGLVEDDGNYFITCGVSYVQFPCTKGAFRLLKTLN